MARYECIKTNEYGGRWYYKGMFYPFNTTPPADYFSAETYDVKRPGSSMGYLDRDNTFFYGENIIGWDDLRFPLAGRRISVSAGRLDYDFTECTLDFSATARYPEEPVAMIAQMPHAKLFGSAVHPHLHWVQQEDEVPNWLLAHRFYNNGDTVPAFELSIWDKLTFTYVSGDLMQIVDFPAIQAPDGETVSAICDMILYRDSANASTLFAGADPYTVGAKSKEFDLHFMTDSLGSGQEYSK